MWYRRSKRRVVRPSSITRHYQANKELARQLLLERLEHYNQHYGYVWNRVAIRNPKRCWGSCTSLKNLNFSYKLLFLPVHLRDYIVVHELCHLAELNHGQPFWDLVKVAMPEYQTYREELHAIERGGTGVAYLIKVQDRYQ